MKHIVSPQQMYAIEHAAFDSGIDPIGLMELASECIAEELAAMIGSRGKAVFFCGKGNNGGDGLAAARIHTRRGGQALIVLREAAATQGAKINLQRAQALGIPVEKELPQGLIFDAAVDALVGIGLGSRLVSAELRCGIESINALDCPVLAVDIPTGIDALTGSSRGICVRADKTLTFGWAKTGHYLSSDIDSVGELVVRDIGISQFAAGMELAEALEEEDLIRCLPARGKAVHKGKNGRVLLYCGSMGMAGAAAMAALGCLRAGAGLVYIACDEAIIPILQILAPNAQCVPIEQALKEAPRHDVFLAGCGLGQDEAVYGRLTGLYNPATPSVLDADALNWLSRRPFGLGRETVITPHVGEAARLLGESTDTVSGDMLASAEKLQRRFGAVAVLKSHSTVIRDDGKTSINTVGSPALAKGGSGDALAGMIAGLMAQGLSGYEAARTASLWLGKAARMAHRRMGPLSPLTGDILALLGEAYTDTSLIP